MKNFTPKQAQQYFKGKFTFTLGDIQVTRKTMERTEWVDNRTERKIVDYDGRKLIVYTVYPFAITDKQICIICPHCQKLHVHSKCEGWRVPHCKVGRTCYTNYYIAKLES